MKLTDFYSDNGAMFVRLFHNKDDFPPIIKSAQLFIDRESMSDLPDTSFAEPGSRMFPICDPASTLLSYTYAKAAEFDVPAPVMENIKTAVNLFGLESEILRLESVITERKRAEAAKKASQKQAALGGGSTDWAIDVRVDAQHQIMAHGSTKESFLQACADICDPNFAKKASLATVKATANALVDEGLRIGDTFYSDIPEDLLKLAGHGYPDPELFQAYVSARSIALPLDKRSDFVAKVANLRATASPSIEGVAKLATLLDQFDRDNGLVKYWGDKFPDPLRSVHCISTREAACLTKKVAIGDTEYRIAYVDREMAKKIAAHVLGLDDYQTHFQKSGFTMTKLAQVLDAEHSKAFNRLMSVS